jgi:DNA-directed RNA polymerase specialized sigma subunit
MSGIENFKVASTCGDAWLNHNDRILSDENITPVLNRRSSSQKCYEELLPEYTLSRKLIKTAKKSIEERDLSQKSVANSIDRELTEHIQLFKERSKNVFYGSYLDLSKNGLLNAQDIEVEIMKLSRTMNNVQIANFYGISETRVRQILKRAYKRAGNHIELKELPHLWFLTKTQAEIAKAKCIFPPVADECLEDVLNLDYDEIGTEMSKALKVIRALNQIENIEEKIEIDIFTRLSVKQRIIYILKKHTDYKSKKIAEVLEIRDVDVNNERQRIKKKIENIYKNPTN